MKWMAATTLSLALLASPAFALKVTNLDSVPHIVQLTGGGAPETRLIQPDATEYFTGAAHGMLSLVDADTNQCADKTHAKKGKHAKKPAAKKHDSVVHADGILSGIIGNERSENIPADPDSNYTIWEGGHLSVQSHSKHGGRAF